MKEVDALLKDLRNAYTMKFRPQMTLKGETEYVCTFGMLQFMKSTISEAGQTIKYLQRDRDSLLQQLTEEGENADAGRDTAETV